MRSRNVMTQGQVSPVLADEALLACWLNHVSQLRKRSEMATALAILVRSMFGEQDNVVLREGELTDRGIAPSTQRRAIRELAKQELVQVEPYEYENDRIRVLLDPSRSRDPHAPRD